MEDLRICHIREPNHGAVTAAFTLTANGSLATGFAFCNSKDQFSRSIGRAVAIGRAKKRPIEITNIEKAENGKIDVVRTILKYLEWCCNTPQPAEQNTLHKLVGVKDYYQAWGPFEHWLDIFVGCAVQTMNKKVAENVKRLTTETPCAS